MASRGINKVILVGNLGSDPETRATNGGSIVTNFRLATGEAWKDQQGQLQDRTEWHRIICWGRLAEIARDYLHKGSKVYLEGRLQTRKWQDKDNKDQYTTEIVAAELQMLDRKPGSADQGPEPAPAPAAAGGAYDDDIPF